MNLTKKEREEITQVYDTWLNSYLNGDVKTYDSFFDDAYHFIGSTDNEDFLDRRSATRFLEDTADQMSGKVQIKNNRRILEKFGRLIFVTELFDAYFLIEEEWTYYGKFRFSSALQKNKEGWRFIYQHFSTPDSKAQKGETIGTEKIAAENLMLREAVQRRTVELEQRKHELQVEAALEKVRARAMAMQKPEELKEVAVLLRNEMGSLGVEELETSSIYLVDEESADCWYAIRDVRIKKNKLVSDHMTLRLQDTWVGREMLAFYHSKQKQTSIAMKGENRKEWINYCASRSSVLQGYYGSDIPERTYHLLKFAGGFMGAASPGNISDESRDLLQRSAKVFSLAYTRFRDLQEASARARETQIELALERTRNHSMLMQHSDEMKDLSKIFHEQLVALNIPSEFSYIWLPDERKGEHIFWATWSELISGKPVTRTKSVIYPLDKSEPYTAACFEAWESDIPVHMTNIPPEEIAKFFATWKDLIKGARKLKAHNFPEGIYYAESYMRYGCFGINIRRPLNEEEKDVLFRFTVEFERAYTRFLDLQKSEAQTREAQVELALERVRSKVTAMQESSELLDIVVTMRSEFVTLGHKADYFWYMHYLPGIYEKAMTSGDGTRIGMVMTLPRHIHGDIKLVADWEESGEPVLVFPMDVETAVEYVHKMITLGDFKQVDPNAPTLDDIRHIGGLTFVMARTTHGEIGYSLAGVVSFPPEEDLTTLVRFASVFDLAYRRFEDLQSAEKRNRETQIELALERVRARTMGMQHSSELQGAADLLFQQVMALGVPAFSCGYNIWEKGEKECTAWMSDPSGGGMNPVYHIPLTEDANFIRFNESKQKGEEFYVLEMGGERMQEHYRYLRKINPEFDRAFVELEKQGTALPETQIHHLTNFEHGNVMFITLEPVPDSYDIFRRFARVFEQTYTRFLDLQKAEAQARQAEQDLIEIKAARKKAEEALTELKAAQSQLIQSEKMASLGELTAGIAHEIQNPLNFVNNFSEVSAELIDEMKQELASGSWQLAGEIADDIKQNLEKINHHGKRADAIVKGMLQHSRTSTGQKEPTEINALADEYLRLAYHGLRAKDKDFNALLRTDFDETIGKINIIPQDIGRVILNLITNAFYAVNERNALHLLETHHDASLPTGTSIDSGTYEPTVTVSTKKTGDRIEISVKDNGNGIPQKILDKIFQPFFTTKPTGHGTGLGLSLSYDIIKAHGGELSVKTTECEGSEFIIQLISG